MLENARLLLVGNPGEVHVGRHFANAANTLGIPLRFLDIAQASSSNQWINRFNYHFNGRHPARLRSFSQQVLESCRDFRPTALLTTGIAPLDAGAIKAIRGLGVRTCNFSTDDPFNPVHRATWFLRALPEYDFVFSPRRANMDELSAAGCRDVSYLPFAYAPEIHFPESPANPAEFDRLTSDVFFAGGADKDRIGLISAMIHAGLKLALYGGYWERYPAAKAQARGLADAATVRKAAGAARTSIGLVRRANRDGHSMRSYELAAMRACLVLEDTAEHREIFGTPGESAVYFRSPMSW